MHHHRLYSVVIPEAEHWRSWSGSCGESPSGRNPESLPLMLSIVGVQKTAQADMVCGRHRACLQLYLRSLFSEKLTDVHASRSGTALQQVSWYAS